MNAVACGPAVLIGIALPSLAQAGLIYGTGFENPPFAGGSQLVGQQGWSAPGFLSPTAATISTVSPASGLQGLRVRGADLTTDPSLAAFGYDAIGSYRRAVNFDAIAAGLPIVRAEADVRLDGPGTTQTADRVTGDFVSANLALTSDDGLLGELALSSDGHVYGYGPNAADSYLFGVPYALGAYQRLAVEANFLTRTVSYYLNGGLLGSVSFADPSLGYTSNTVNRGSLILYANLPDGGPQTRDQYTAYYDNFSITAVPEPASVAMVGVGFVGLAVARRRRG